jgi:hypothetical protein
MALPEATRLDGPRALHSGQLLARTIGQRSVHNSARGTPRCRRPSGHGRDRVPALPRLACRPGVWAENQTDRDSGRRTDPAATPFRATQPVDNQARRIRSDVPFPRPGESAGPGGCRCGRSPQPGRSGAGSVVCRAITRPLWRGSPGSDGAGCRAERNAFRRSSRGRNRSPGALGPRPSPARGNRQPVIRSLPAVDWRRAGADRAAPKLDAASARCR